MNSMTYPDGEVLQYRYNRAGMVSGLSGTRDGVTHDYVRDIFYDLYGRQHRIGYGNGASTTFDFDPAKSEVRNIVQDSEILPYALPLERFLEWVKRG